MSLAGNYGWEFGGPIAVHLIGQFPHERIAEGRYTLRLSKKQPAHAVDRRCVKFQDIQRVFFSGESDENRGLLVDLFCVLLPWR